MNLFGVGPTEIFVVLIVILVLFGPDRLPEIAKKIGNASRDLRGNLDSLNEQMNSALETSMELDKARMIKPVEQPAETATGEIENLPPESSPAADSDQLPSTAAAAEKPAASSIEPAPPSAPPSGPPVA